MKIQYYIPEKLHGIVDHIWEQQSSIPSRWTILPSGKIELLFRVGNPPRIISALKIGEYDNPVERFCFMSGLHTRPITMHFECFHMMGIQMRPVAFKALFGIPLNEIRDYYLPGSVLFDTLNQIEDKIKGKGSFMEKARWLEKLISSRINETPELHFAIDLSRACEKFIRVNSVQTYRSIEEMIGYSRTHTFRIFNDWFGVAAHRYQKLIQFVQAIHDIHRCADKLTSIGLNNGYFDQAHFIRSFKTFAGITPGEYRKRMTLLPGQFSA